MKDKITRLFLSDEGKAVQNDILRAIDEYSMADSLNRGVLVGFSGGADSVMLLSFLAYFSDFGTRFPLLAVHVNHSIRGDEADRDVAFAKNFCNSLGIEFLSVKIDVPTLAAETKTGLEECARNCRYLEFQRIIQSRNDILAVCVAHNADDNLETVLLNLLRGSGTRGVAGIPPVRDNIVRPLIYLTKRRIVSCLLKSGIEFVFDSTNSDNEYKRNYIRNEILPKLRHISDEPEMMAARASHNLRVDDDFICSVASDFLKSHSTVRNSNLVSLHEAVFVRALSMMADVSLSSVNVSELRKLLSEDNFSYSLPGRKKFVCEYGVCRVLSSCENSVYDYSRKLKVGINSFDDFDADVIVIKDNVEVSFSNVYKFSIQARLSSAIIKGDLFLRSKMDGDVIKYGGMTRKVKKLFNDRKIPPSVRCLIPLVCDDFGPLFVPGFGVREDSPSVCEGSDVRIFIGIGKGDVLKETRFHFGNEAYK